MRDRLCGRRQSEGQDVKSIGMDVLRYRVAIIYEAEAEENQRNSHPENLW